MNRDSFTGLVSLSLMVLLLFMPTVIGNDVEVNLDAPDPNITSVWNNQTNDSSTSLNIKPDNTIEFGVKSDQEIGTWYWTNADNVDSTNTTSNATKNFGSSGGTVEVYGENINGTTNTITWSINVEEDEEDEEDGGAPGNGGEIEPTPTTVKPTPMPPSAKFPWIWVVAILGIGAAVITVFVFVRRREDEE